MKYYELRKNSDLTQPLLNLSLNNNLLALGWKSFSHCSPVVEWGSVKHTYQSRISLHLQKILSQPKLSKVWHKWGKKKKLCSDSFNCKGTFGNWHSYVIEPLVLEEKLRFFEDFFFLLHNEETSHPASNKLLLVAVGNVQAETAQSKQVELNYRLTDWSVSFTSNTKGFCYYYFILFYCRLLF